MRPAPQSESRRREPARGAGQDRPTLLFWTYDPEVPSFRHRLRHLLPLLEARGWRCRVVQAARGRYFLRLLARRSELRQASLVVLAKVRLGLGEGVLARRLARRLVFDFDDALFLRRPRFPGAPPDRSWLRRRKFAATCRSCDLVMAGNDFLAAAARPWSRRVEVLPTPVDLEAYPELPPAVRRDGAVVWIGRPENLVYLEPLRAVFTRLAGRVPDFRLRVICSRFPDWPDVPIERIAWSAAAEAEQLATAAVGIMPLSDDDWARGKCAFKLLQYMAAGLPTVASPVGENSKVVVEAETGFLASDPDQWFRRLEELLASRGLRAHLGAAGRERVRQRYARQVIAPRVVALLEATAAPTAGDRHGG
ncbi:MAG: glycosyltransferase family 4 protein [Thermoanaerobaculia bacterium]